MNKKISKKKLVIKFPKEIRELAEEFRLKRVKKERAERQRSADEKLVLAARLEARLKNGLRYATKVFLWAQALKESDVGQELMKKSHIPTAYSSIIFFDGHIVGVPWVGLGISPKGLFLTNGGHLHYTRQVSSPEELAESVPTVILEMASEWIDNGEVWDCIKRHFD